MEWVSPDTLVGSELQDIEQTWDFGIVLRISHISSARARRSAEMAGSSPELAELDQGCVSTQ